MSDKASQLKAQVASHSHGSGAVYSDGGLVTRNYSGTMNRSLNLYGSTM